MVEVRLDQGIARTMVRVVLDQRQERTMDEELDGDELCEWSRADNRCEADDILHDRILDHQLASRFAESTLCL